MMNPKEAPLYKGFVKIFSFFLLAMVGGFLGWELRRKPDALTSSEWCGGACTPPTRPLMQDVARSTADASQSVFERVAAALFGWHSDVAPSMARDIGQGLQGHQLPPMYGKVKEKTIWLFWDNPDKIPPFAQLCIETVKLHRGTFDVRLLDLTTAMQYVSPAELPARWDALESPAQQKDSLMTALLARYGGVAMDATVIMFKPIDDWWDDMVSKGALFRGYQYDHQDWRNKETVVWFLMARREGLFRSAATAQVIGMGSATNTDAYGSTDQERYFALGDGTITPIIGMYDYARQRCSEPSPGAPCYPPVQTEADVGAPLGPDKLIISDPMDPMHGPQFGFANDHDFTTWNVARHPISWDAFMQRFQGGGLYFVKMFGTGGDAKSWAHSDMVNHKGTFACEWLCTAGYNVCEQAACRTATPFELPPSCTVSNQCQADGRKYVRANYTGIHEYSCGCDSCNLNSTCASDSALLHCACPL